MTRNTYPSLARPGDTIPPAAPFDVLHPSIESQVLVDWILGDVHGRILDLGCGNGFMSLAIAHRGRKIIEVTGIDINAEAINVAKKTAAEILDDNSPMVRFITADVKNRKSLQALGRFTYVISNPPFFEKELNVPTSPKEKQLAHSEVSMNVMDLCQAARQAVMREGHFVLCHLARRRRQIEGALKKNFFRIVDEATYEGVREGDGGIVYFLTQYIGHEH